MGGELAHFHNIISEFVIVVAAATVGAILCGLARIPTLVGFILSGIIIGPYGLKLVDNVPGASHIAELGVIFLLFTIGLELSFDTIKRHKRLIVGTGMCQVLLTVFLTSLVAYFGFKLSYSQAVFWGFLVSLSSTAIVMKLIFDARETNSPYGAASTAILITQDMAVIPMTLLIPVLASTHTVMDRFSAESLMPWIMRLAVAGLIFFVSAKFILPWLMERVVKTRSRDVFLFAILLTCLGAALLFENMGLSLSLGAFAAGLVLAESPFGHQAVNEVIPLRDSFLALFFASIGMLVDMRFFATHALPLLGLFVLVFGLKFFVILVAAQLARIPLATAVVTGSMVFQIGEFSFVLAGLGREKGLMSDMQFQYFLAITLMSMLITPFAIKYFPKWFLSRWQAGDADYAKGKSSSAKDGQNDVIIVGYGVAGANLESFLKTKEVSYKIIEQNYGRVKKYHRGNKNIVFGDGSDPETLHRVGIETAKVAVVCISGLRATEAVSLKILEMNPQIEIIVRVQYSLEADKLASIVERSAVINAEQLSSSALIEKVDSILHVSDGETDGETPLQGRQTPGSELEATRLIT